MIASWDDRRAARKILGAEARIGEVEVLRTRSGGRTIKFALRDGAERYVLKSHRDRERCATETWGLRAAGSLEGVGTPRYLGSHGKRFIQEYIEGPDLATLSSSLSAERHDRLCAEVARVLAAIHASKDANAELARLPDPPRARGWEAHVRRLWSDVETRGFDRYERLQGELPREWRGLVSEPVFGELAEDLCVSRADSVLSHGDFHMRNVISADVGGVHVVDWGTLSLAAPWIDLAHPLRWARTETRAELLTSYLEEMHKRDRLRAISEERAQRLARSGNIYERLATAKALVRKLRSRGDGSYVSAFRRIVDQLAAALG